MSEMKRCYVFAIGGTGARVLEASVIQMAAGCGYEVFENWEVVPIIIDLDEENGNTSQTRRLLQNYVEVHSILNESMGISNFFKTQVKRLKDVSKAAESDSFTMKINLTNKPDLRSMVDYDGLGADGDLTSTQNLVDLLFTREELNMSLQHGFKGKPNIGSVVFGQLAEKENGDYKNKDFGAFVHGFKEGDRVFVMGSIFGGTGAAGIPWLIKEIRNNKDNEALKEANIGLLSVMPYFSVSHNPQSKIDSNDFILKTKSALQYYHYNLKEPNSIFYIADSNDHMEHTNVEGGANQKNTPHIVEFLAATSLTKFLSVSNEVNKADDPIALRYGVSARESKVLYLDDFDPKSPTYQWINTPLTKFYLAHLLILKVFKLSNNISWKFNTRIIEKVGGNFLKSQMDESFFKHSFYQSFERFIDHFNGYLDGLDGEGSDYRIFSPYLVNPSVGGNKLDDRHAISMNKIIRNADVSEGYHTIDKEKIKRLETTYWYSEKRIRWGEFVSLVNEQIRTVNRLVHEDANKQKAIRLDELLYLSSSQFLAKYKLFNN